MLLSKLTDIQRGSLSGEGTKTNHLLQPTRLAATPRCLARTRSGAACQSPAVRGKRRCRMHGGTNPGAPKGNRNAWKHGARSASAMQAAAFIKAMARLVQECDLGE